VLNLESSRLNAFGVDDEQLAGALASQAAIALSNVRLFERGQILQTVARDLLSVREVDALLNEILKRAVELLRCPIGSIAMRDRVTD
jgi:GAF domain-containing protein